MVVAGRLLWIIDKIRMGHQVVVTSSFNANGERQKLKVLIQPIAGAVFGSEINQCFALAAVMSLSHIASNETLASGVCITDRGHKNSTGVSEVSFWMKVKKAAFDGNDVKETMETTVVEEDVAGSAVAAGSFASQDRTSEQDTGETDYVSGVWSVRGNVAASADGEEKSDDAVDPGAGGLLGVGGEDLTGIGSAGILVDTEDLGLIDGVSNTDAQVEWGSRQKKPRLLVEM